MERLNDYKHLLADPTPEMHAKARTRARVFDEGVLPEQGSATVVAAESLNDLPQHQEFRIQESSDHHATHSQQQQQQDFRIHEDPVVTVFGIDPSEVRGALQSLVMRPVSPDMPYGQENEPPMTMMGEREVSAETVQGEGEMEGRGREGGRMFSMGLGFMGVWR